MRIDVSIGDDVTEAVRTALAESVVIVIAPGRDLLALTLVLAAIGPLAIERAPMRINAVVPTEHARTADVDAAVAFLASARSTTGQVLAID